jgi:hypothetical protein
MHLNSITDNRHPSSPFGEDEAVRLGHYLGTGSTHSYSQAALAQTQCRWSSGFEPGGQSLWVYSSTWRLPHRGQPSIAVMSDLSVQTTVVVQFLGRVQ